MSVTNATLRSPATGGYACDGSTTAFAGTFNLLAEGDVDVILTDVNGTESTLTLTTDYTVAPTGGSYPCTAFTVTTVSTYASGNTITLIRNMDLTQPTTYGNAGPYYPSIHETSYDRLLLQLQQQQEILDRCVKDAAGATATTDPDSYLASCQAAQTAAAASAASVAAASTNLFHVDVMVTTNVDVTTAIIYGQTIDGVTLDLDDRILLTGQTTVGEDGIYYVASGSSSPRAGDYPVGTKCRGHLYSVSRGTTYANTAWATTNDATDDTIGTNGIDIQQVLLANTADDKHWVRRSGVMAEESITSAGAALLDDASASAQRTTLGLGTMATQAASAVAITGGTIKGSGVGTVDEWFFLEHTVADTVAGGATAATTWQKRTLTSLFNNISGASVASSVITLPAGTYYVDGWQCGYSCGAIQSRLYQTSGSPQNWVVGGVTRSDTAAADQTIAPINGKFTLSGSADIEFQMYSEATQATNGMGVPSSSGEGETYANLIIWKVG